MKGIAPKEGLVRWNKIYSVLSTHKGVRNLIAHQGMHVGAPNERGEVIVLLKPPWLKKNSKGRELDVESIRSTADAITRAHGELWKLIDMLTRNTGLLGHGHKHNANVAPCISARSESDETGQPSLGRSQTFGVHEGW